MVSFVLLATGVIGALARPRRVPACVVPACAALLALALGTVDQPVSALRPLAGPIAFLLAAVPLAALLDRLGFFVAAAQLAGRGRHLALGLWVLGAAVTAVLNLDAAVVLLTPLYVQIARRRGLDPLALAFQPVLLSCVASSALPVSNLTNLIVASAEHLDALDFLAHLALPTLASTTVGWFAYRRACPSSEPVEVADLPVEHRALRIGGVLVLAVLIGFTFGPALGVPEWITALVADLVLLSITRTASIRDVPWDTALLAGSLGVLAAGAASHLDLTAWFEGSSNLDLVRISVFGGLGANAVNNLPALLVALPHTGSGVWALLLGVNVGPFVVTTGTLAALLWQTSLRRLGVPVTAAQFARVGTRVLVPSAAAAIATLLVLRPVVGG
jgi:arsenical pump membrane protein